MSDFSNLNNLPTEDKILLANAQSLLDETKEMISSHKYPLDMTSLWQLKGDCREEQMLIKMIQKNKKIEKNLKLLSTSLVRLRTNLTGIVNFNERG